MSMLNTPDPHHAVGVDITNLLVSQPDTGESALEIVDLVRSAAVDIVVIDSVAALVPVLRLKAIWVMPMSVSRLA